MRVKAGRVGLAEMESIHTMWLSSWNRPPSSVFVPKTTSPNQSPNLHLLHSSQRQRKPQSIPNLRTNCNPTRLDAPPEMFATLGGAPVCIVNLFEGRVYVGARLGSRKYCEKSDGGLRARIGELGGWRHRWWTQMTVTCLQWEQ